MRELRQRRFHGAHEHLYLLAYAGVLQDILLDVLRKDSSKDRRLNASKRTPACVVLEDVSEALWCSPLTGASQGGAARVGPAAGSAAAVEAIGALTATLQLTLCDRHADTLLERLDTSSAASSAPDELCNTKTLNSSKCARCRLAEEQCLVRQLTSATCGSLLLHLSRHKNTLANAAACRGAELPR